MGFENLIASRHLTRRHKLGFISMISMISVIEVALGVWALVVVLAVMSGYDFKFKEKFVNVQPHLTVSAPGGGVENYRETVQKIKSLSIPGLETISGYIQGEAMLQSENKMTGIFVKGLDTAHEKLSIYESHLMSGNVDLEDRSVMKTQRRFFFFKKKVEYVIPQILIGQWLSETLGVRVGDSVTLIVVPKYQEAASRFSFKNVESKTFVVSGIFRIGLNDIDSKLALTHLAAAQEMFHFGHRVDAVGLRFENVDDAEKWKFELANDLEGNYFVRSWYDLNSAYFQALKVEKSTMTVILSLIILVAALSIVATLTMVVMEKTKDIGILRALGATQASIRKIFVSEGLTIGIYGIILGSILGPLTALNLNVIFEWIRMATGFDLFPRDVYGLEGMPARIQAQDMGLVLILALIACLLASIYPARRAAKLNPVEALRYE